MPDLRERLLHPREGWLSLGLLMIMLLALSWSVQTARWLDHLDFLMPVALFAALVGGVLGLLPLSVALTLPISALIGGAFVLWTIGGEYFPALELGAQFDALREESISWLIVVLQTGYPSELSPYAVGLGVLMWTSGFIATYTVFRHHRVLDAILLVGVLIVANMSATLTDLFVQLLIFVCAALLLWLRATLLTREEGWQRRRVNENLEVPASIMRSGVIFGGGTVALAWILTTVAVAAPLTEAWRGLDTVWTDVRDSAEGIFGNLTNPQARITGNTFGSGFVVSGSWVSRDDEVLVLAASRPLYLRTAAYDAYTGRGFERSETTKRGVEAGGRLFPGETPERPSAINAFDIETVEIELRDTVARNLFVPGYPMRIFAPAVVSEVSGAPVLGGLDAASAIGAGQSYQVQAALSKATEAELRAAGTEYPALVGQLYLDASRVTPRVAELAQQVAADAEGETPYDLAKALARYLSRGDSFSYATEAMVPEPDQDLVDYFLFDREANRTGFCQYYSVAMAMMARSLGIPARVAVGFAPGERTAEGTYLVRQANAHAWAELYFPGYGWQIFEATKTIDSGFRRDPGEPGAVPVQPPDGRNPLLEFEQGEVGGAISALPSPAARVEGAIDATTGEAPSSGAGGGGAIVFVLVAMAVLGFVGYRLWSGQRRFRFLPAGDRTWHYLAGAADRAGVRQRPSETIYEYSGWLEDQIPSRRPEIRTIADGKVWQSYSGRALSHLAAGRLESAWRRLRLPLVSLTLRHWVRGLLRRS